MQEEAGCLCTSVEGFEAEVEAFIFGVKKVSMLFMLSCKELSPYAAGGCAAGSCARRLYPFRLGAFASACSTD